jgi:choline dehydrogenase-like flavoprotein
MRKRFPTLGIPVVADCRLSGRNLRDHVDFVIAYESSRKDLIGFMPGDIVNAFRSAIRYHRDRRGIFTSNIAEAGGFLKTSPELAAPDIQLHFCIGHSREPRSQAAREARLLDARVRVAAAQRGDVDARERRSAGGAVDRSRLLQRSRTISKRW